MVKCTACGTIHLSYQCPVCECHEVCSVSDNAPPKRRPNNPLHVVRRRPPPLRASHKPADASAVRKRLQSPFAVDAERDPAD